LGIYLDERLGTALPVVADENEKPVRCVYDLQPSADVSPSEDGLAAPRTAATGRGERDVDRPTRLPSHGLPDRARWN